MNLEQNESQIRKGVLEILILMVLSVESYGGDITTKLKDHSVNLPEGTLYTILSRLNKNGYVTYRWKESTGGPPRKYFKISKAGSEYLSDSLDSLNHLNQVIKKLSA